MQKVELFILISRIQPTSWQNYEKFSQITKARIAYENL